MTITPAERLQRLRRHALAGWLRAIGDGTARERALRWLGAHPSAMAEVDALWREALQSLGPLAAWLTAGAVVEHWSLTRAWICH